jgi:hypothetical protein
MDISAMRPRVEIKTSRSYSVTLIGAIDDIRCASDEGKGVQLTAAQVRALDWSVIREYTQEEWSGEELGSRWKAAAFMMGD